MGTQDRDDASGSRKRRYALSDRVADPLDLDRHLPFQIAVLANLLKVDRDPLVRALTPLGGRELRVLINVGSHAPVGAADIAYQSRLGTHMVSRAVKVLVGEGLVATRDDVLDQRRQMLELTEAGQALYRRIAKILDDRARKLGMVLSEDEAALLQRLLARLEDRAEEVLAGEVIERMQTGETLSADQKELLRWYRRGAP